MFLQRARYLCMPALLCGAQRSRPALRVRSLAKILALQGVLAHLVDLCQRAADAEEQ